MANSSLGSSSSTATGKPISLLPILLVNFIGTLGYSIILPFLVFIVTRFGGNEVIYGVMGATYSFFQLIGAPVLGSLSDKYGRRKILILSQGGTLLAWILFLIALFMPESTLLGVDSSFLGSFILTLPLLMLFVARALDGLTGGNVSVANAYLADITEENDRKSNFGKMGASANMGFILGPAMAGILGSTVLGEVVPVIAAAIISLVALGVIAFRLPESKPCVLTQSVDKQKTRKVLGQEHKECHEMAGAEKITLRKVFQLPQVPFMITLYFLIFLAFNFFYVAFPVYAQGELEWDVFQLGIFFSLLSFIMVLVQGPLMSKLSTLFNDSPLIIAGCLLLGVSFLCITSSNEVLVYASAVFFSLGNGIMWPSFLSMLSRTAGDEYQGAVQGYASSAGSLASIIGLLIGGVLYSFVGSEIFAIPAVLILVIAVLSVRLLRVEKSWVSSGSEQ